MYQDTLNKDKLIVEAYNDVKRSTLRGWGNMGTVAKRDGYSVDLVRHWKPDDTVNFFAHVFCGNKKVSDRQIFSGTHSETDWNQLEDDSKKTLDDYLTK